MDRDMLVSYLRDTLFVDVSAHDFRLTPESPARDSGDNLGVLQDFVGNVRPEGAGYDMGAYENTARKK